jgi:hypothetical protein
MRLTKRLFSLTITLLLSGAAQASASTEDLGATLTDAYDQQQAWDAAALEAEQAALGEPAFPQRSTGPIKLQGCWYVAEVDGEWLPDIGALTWLLVVERLPSTGCAQERRLLASSYAGGPPYMIALEHQGLALAFQSKQSPWGATHQRIYHVDPATLSVVRQASLGSTTGMYTEIESMSLEGNRLIVHGIKEGPIPGEVGSGNRFVATFPHFFTSQEAPSIFSYLAPDIAVSTSSDGNAALTEEQQRQLEEQMRAEETAALEKLRTLLASTGEAPSAQATPEPKATFVDDGITESDALEYLRASEPEKLSALAARPRQVRGCWYFISSTTVGWPPLRTVYILTRMPSRSCKGQSSVIGSTYSWRSIQAVAREGQGIAIAFQQKWTLSGSGLHHTEVVAIDPRTMAITRSIVLGTYQDSTYLEGLRFDKNDLIVNTSRYTATFPRFLTSELPPQGVIFP